MIRFLLIISLVCLATSMACTPNVVITESPEEANPQAFFAGKWEAYGTDLLRGDADAVAAWFTEDAILMEPGIADLRGRDSIRSFLASAFAVARATAVEIKPEEVLLQDDRAHEWGAYTETIEPMGESAGTQRGRYAAVWQRQPDKTWKIARLLINHLPKQTST